MPRENGGLCPLCKSNQVEDKIHFFFQCNKYSVQRQAFINQINRIIIPDFDKKSSPESINKYQCEEDKNKDITKTPKEIR